MIPKVTRMWISLILVYLVAEKIEREFRQYRVYTRM